MDFETSCWSTGNSLNNGAPEFYNNPVQRRPKIDYFDSSTITPMVSHISSNGYYGYCPTMRPHVADVHQVNSPPNATGTATDNDCMMSDMGMPERPEIEPQHPIHQQRSTIENRKRSVQFDDESVPDQDFKRKRQNHESMIDYTEDMQMSSDDAQDVTDSALTNFGNSSSLNNDIDSTTNPTDNANTKPNGSHIQSSMMMSHMI